MSRRTNTARRRQEQTTRERAAAARAVAQRRERRRRLWLVVGSTIAVLVVIGGIVAAGVLSSHSTKSAGIRAAAAPTVVQQVTGVPAATLASIGKGSVATMPKAVQDAALTANGKPQVLFIGAEYCPYCATERWPLVQALSRFGSFKGLKTTHSSSTDVYPNTATFSFYGSTYTSPYLSFEPRELYTNQPQGNQYKPLQKLDKSQQTLFSKYGSGFPFLDFAGHYVVTGPSYDPGVLKGLTAQQIAGRLADPSSDVAKAVDGAANVITATICKVTNGQPASVCSTAGVTAAAKALNG